MKPCAEPRENLWMYSLLLRRTWGVVAACVLCLAATACRSAGWRTEEDRALRNRLVRLVTRLRETEPALRQDSTALEEVAATIEKAPPRYSRRHRAYYWQGRTWAVEFGLEHDRARQPDSAIRSLPAFSDIRVFCLQIVNPETRVARRFSLFEDRRELRRKGPTIVLALQRRARSLGAEADVKRVITKVVETETTFWGAKANPLALAQAIKRTPGTKDEESAAFEWRAGRFAARIDCAHIETRREFGGKIEKQPGTYYVNAIRLTVFDEEGRIVRSLYIRADESVLTVYGPMLSAAGL